LSLFATGPGESLYENQEDEDYTDLIEKIAKAVVQRQLTVPVIILLESVKPLSFLGNQLLIFANPVVSLIIQSKNYYRFVRMSEERENLEKLILAIEEENARDDQRRKARKAAQRKNKRSFWSRIRLRRSGRETLKGDGIDQHGDHQDSGD